MENPSSNRVATAFLRKARHSMKIRGMSPIDMLGRIRDLSDLIKGGADHLWEGRNTPDPTPAQVKAWRQERKALLELFGQFELGAVHLHDIKDWKMYQKMKVAYGGYPGGPGQYGDATEDPSIYHEEEVDPCEENPEYIGMSLDDVVGCAPDAVDDWMEAAEGVMAGLKRLGFKVREGKDWHEDGQLRMRIFIQGPLGKAEIDITGNIDPNGQLKRGWGLYAGIVRGADWWDLKHLKHGEIEMDGGNVRRFVKKVLEVWADGGMNRTRRASSKASAERVAAAFLKQGSWEIHKEWQAAYRSGMGDMQKRWTALLNKAGRQFKKDDWKLEPQSWLGHYNHGSDGARMDGMLFFEDLRNEARGTRETEDWLEANLGLSYNLTGRGYGKWSLSLEE